MYLFQSNQVRADLEKLKSPLELPIMTVCISPKIDMTVLQQMNEYFGY